MSIDQLVEELDYIESAEPAGTRPEPDPQRVVGGVNRRLTVVAEMVAKRAAKYSNVESFRRRWLRDGLVNPANVTAWIDGIYHDHLPSGWPTDRGPADATNATAVATMWPHPHETLEWIDTDGPTSRIWPVPRRGPLADLSKLSTKLSRRWGWHPATSSAFVLTNATPPRPGVRGVTYQSVRGSDGHFGPYDFMSVKCSIDIEVTPEELAAWWSGVRHHLGVSGRRPISDKAVALAAFAFDRDETTTWRQDMEAWNRQAPGTWRYTDYRAYRTAAIKAIEALNRPALEAWPR